jgi:hypothetical protein
MAAQTQLAPLQISDSALEEAIRRQADLRATLSPEPYEERRQQSILELLEITERSSAYAEAQGMTDELLEQLLGDESALAAGFLFPPREDPRLKAPHFNAVVRGINAPAPSVPFIEFQCRKRAAQRAFRGKSGNQKARA